jgi:hypothetical protein
MSHRALLRLIAAAPIAIIVLSLASCSSSQPEGKTSDAQADVARLERKTALLERQLELARGKDFYLVLDPSAPNLALMLRGAELQRYPVLGLTVGRPRVGWITRGSDRPWRGVVWSSGVLEPSRPAERIVVEEPTGSQEDDPTPPPVPPTAEERLPVPSRYLIRFGDGLSMEVRPREADTEASGWTRFRTWWSVKWRDALTALRRDGHDTVRVRVVLQPPDAEALYRALPPDVKLLVLDGTGD